MSQNCDNWERLVGAVFRRDPKQYTVWDERFPRRQFEEMSVAGAKELQIELGNDSSYWNWTSHAYSRFPEVAELKSLRPEGAQGLEVAKAEVKFVEDERGKQVEREEVRPTVVHLQPTKETNGKVAIHRTDGWMEVDIGNFIFQNGYEGEVKARLRDTMPRMKTGPIIDGIEFRPVYTEVKFLPNTVSRNRRGRGGGNFSRFNY
ncbi:putative F-box protein PP2-B6 [Primulina huaijiensis]|uniref:putative F-box protein PP2-B6 n=1 Tax=Primulina huaijiensis TaxID=1492673 RepID=UPI003CC77610